MKVNLGVVSLTKMRMIPIRSSLVWYREIVQEGVVWSNRTLRDERCTIGIILSFLMDTVPVLVAEGEVKFVILEDFATYYRCTTQHRTVRQGIANCELKPIPLNIILSVNLTKKHGLTLFPLISGPGKVPPASTALHNFHE